MSSTKQPESLLAGVWGRGDGFVGVRSAKVYLRDLLYDHIDPYGPAALRRFALRANRLGRHIDRRIRKRRIA